MKRDLILSCKLRIAGGTFFQQCNLFSILGGLLGLITFSCGNTKVRCKKPFIMTDRDTLSISHFSLSSNFFQLVENILSETIVNGNIDIYFGFPREDIHEHYSNITKSSDFRIFIPTLFNFFHGIELLLKGANYKINVPNSKPNHKLAKLLTDFQNNYPNATELYAILHKYIYPDCVNCKILFNFYSSNNITDSSKFIEFLKYPYSQNFTTDFNHSKLKNLGHDGIVFLSK